MSGKLINKTDDEIRTFVFQRFTDMIDAKSEFKTKYVT